MTARKPSGAPAAAAPRTMSWVDGQSGRSDASWPKRWLVAGAADSATWLQYPALMRALSHRFRPGTIR